LWQHLFRQGHAVEHVHVLVSFKRFVSKTTLASGGVNVVEQSVPAECKAQFAAMLCAQPRALVSPRPFLAKCNAPREASCHSDKFPLPAFRVAGAQAPTRKPQGFEGDDGITKTNGKGTGLEGDCSALEAVLARLEAAVQQQRPSPELRARFVALGSRFERMRGLMSS